MRIETDRLFITEFTMDMAQVVHENSLDEDNRRFVPDEVFETVEEARKTIAFLMSRYSGSEGPLAYPVLTRAGGENIGYVQMVPLDGGGWEIGYHIAKKYTGKGYATEAVRAFLPRMAEAIGAGEVRGICLKENAASARVLTKCGFIPVFEGIGDYQGEKREVFRSVWKPDRNDGSVPGGDACVRLVPMTPAMLHRYFMDYESDPDLWLDKEKYVPYVYSEERVEQYIRRQAELKRVNLAIMAGDDIIGQIIIKNIEPHRCATLGLSLRKARYKDHGFGTQAEKLAVQYVFNEMDIPVLYADAIQPNTRSQHVLEKVGFRFIREDKEFRYYRIDRDAGNKPVTGDPDTGMKHGLSRDASESR